MNSAQNKKKSLHINKFQSLTPSYRNNEQIFDYNNFDTITERKYMPLIFTKYKPYSQYRKTQQSVSKFGDYFNSTIEHSQYQQKQKIKTPCSLTPIRKISEHDRIKTDPPQVNMSNVWGQKSQIKEFSINFPIIQMNHREGTVLKKKRRIVGLKISLK